MNTRKLQELALQQLDNVGYQLRVRGITDKVNRHDIAALVMAGQDRFKGEMTRLELRVELQKARLEKARNEAEVVAEKLVSFLPQPLVAPASRIKEKVFAAIP